MKYSSIALLSLLTLPSSAKAETVQTFLPNFVTFIGETVIVFLIGLAFIIFVFNAVRFFILEGTTEQGREKAKSLMVWSVAAFTVIIVFWGVINIIGSSLGIAGGTQREFDYINSAP